MLGKYLKHICIALLLSVAAVSCEDGYLDQAPESGLSEKEVFSSYESTMLFFDAVYWAKKDADDDFRTLRVSFPLYFAGISHKFTFDAVTDIADMGRMSRAHDMKNGTLGSNINSISINESRAERPILKSMFNVIRIANYTLERIDMITDARRKEDIDDLRAQIHFVRAYAHFELFRFWGSMPYIDYVIGPDDEWDIPQLSEVEMLKRIADDFDVAAEYFEKAGRMRRDGKPGEPGHLNHPDQERPNGVAALAFKSRALLYRASPLNNKSGDIRFWEEAAIASWEAIQAAEEYGYARLDPSDYKRNYVFNKYSNEQIWAYYAGRYNYVSLMQHTLNTGPMTNANTFASGVCPTQNMVDRFETADGFLLITDADRDAAIAAGSYNPQDPYANRDPRFYHSILYNGAPLVGFDNGVEIWRRPRFGTMTYSYFLDPGYAGIPRTGYMVNKTFGNNHTRNRVGVDYTDPIMRLGELYLNYSEAANEAYGPNGSAPGASKSALQTLNEDIRNHIGMPSILTPGSKDNFRERIKNERTVELCFEGHQYYHDIRRWMDAPKAHSQVLMGMDIEKLAAPTAEYPTGYKYTRVALNSDRQISWKDAMYYLPFPTDDNFMLRNFEVNEVW